MAGRLPFLLLLVMLAVAGCETTQSGDESVAFTPADAIVESRKYQGRDVVWGGVLIATTNQKDRTTLEILTYPLVNGRPQLSRPSTGRVLASVPGFLEPSDYAPGRNVVVEGMFTGVRHGYSGGVSTTHAVLEARKAGLRATQDAGWRSNLHIGIGISTGL
ncbi:MAG: Slp family lipoprotein [Gammaproteobacteria bacterium]